MKLEVKNIHKSFGDKEVLKGIDFSVDSGRALGLLGRNGAGKTTSIRIIMDIFRADQGEVLLDGEKFVPGRHHLGYLPEERGMYPKKKVLEQMVYFARLRGLDKRSAIESCRKWLERLKVSEYEKKEMNTLSKGNQQKVQLAATLVGDPDILVLDEPFSGLDPVNAQILKDVVRERIAVGKIVIFSSHQMSYVEEFCEDIVILRDGEVTLRGELEEIQKARGRGKKVLAVQGMEPEKLKLYCQEQMTDLLTVDSVGKEGLVTSIREGIDSWQLLERLREAHLEIERYSFYKPSLSEIFVECAGDEPDSYTEQKGGEE